MLPEKRMFMTGKGRQGRSRQQERKPPSLSLCQKWLLALRTHPLMVGIWSIFGLAALIATVVGGYVAADSQWGPFFPQPPTVTFEEGDATSLVTHFKITNASPLYLMRDVRLVCGIQAFWGTGRGFSPVSQGDMAFESIMPPASLKDAMHYSCDASILIRANPDGSLGMRGGFQTAPAGFPGPLKVMKVCEWIGIDWEVLGFWHRHFDSHIFQWPSVLNGNAWSSGPAFTEPKEDASSDERIFAATRCHDGPYAPYYLFRPDGVGCLIKQERTGTCIMVKRIYDQGGGHHDLIAPNHTG